MHEVAFRGVSKVFADGTWAVREVSFVAPAGKLTTLLGPSGSGKSTLLRMAAGLEGVSAGQVLLGGRDVTQLPAAERGMTLLFQGNALFPHLDVLGNVGFGLRQARVPKPQVERAARRVLELVGLAGYDHASCEALSGGEQQRVALARALALEPAVLLLDEPLSNLDDRLRRRMREELRLLQQRLGVTMIYVTHDEAEAMALSDLVVILNEGRLLQAGTPREVYERPASEFVAAFMGDASIFDVVAGDDGEVRLAGLAITRWTGRHPAGARLRVLVRPEAWRMQPVGEGEGLPAKVTRGAYLGHGAEYVVDSELGELLVKTWHAQSLHQPGAPVSLLLGPQGVTVLQRP